jgi:hypothetical protein
MRKNVYLRTWRITSRGEKVGGECGGNAFSRAHMTDEKYMGAEGKKKVEMVRLRGVAEGMFSHRNTLDLLCGFAERRKLSLGGQRPTLLLARWESRFGKSWANLWSKAPGTLHKPDLVLKLAV